MQNLVIFIIVFSIVVIAHEWGHLYFAKRAGIMCHEFAIGMGPKIFQKKYGETLYTIRLLPVGGYVKMAGQMDIDDQLELKPGMQLALKLDEHQVVTDIYLDQHYPQNEVDVILEFKEADLVDHLTITGLITEDFEHQLMTYQVSPTAVVIEQGVPEQIAPRDRHFTSKSPLQRFLTLFGGPLMNFVLALIIFIGISAIQGVPSTTAQIGGFSAESPAQQAGLMVSDNITKINGMPTQSWQDIGQAMSKVNGQQAVTVEYQHEGQVKTVAITPKMIEQKIDKNTTQSRAILGIEAVRDHNVLRVLQQGFTDMWTYGTQIFIGVGLLFKSIFTGGFSFNQLAGPVGIYKVTSEAASNGLLVLAKWIAILSVNLGIMNLLPIPALDGGRIVFVIYEAIFKRPVNKKFETYLTLAFVGVLFMVMILVTWNDIQHVFFGK